MTSTAAKLNKYLGKDLPEEFVVHMIMKSLPKEYETFHVHYNTTVKDRWTIDQLMAQCLQEEERLKSHKGDSINYASNQLKKMNKSSKPPSRKALRAMKDSPPARLPPSTTIMVERRIRANSSLCLSTLACTASRRGTTRRIVMTT